MTTIVVPCFDEAQRLDVGALRALAEEAAATVLLVDDGSTDGTGELIRRAVAAHPAQLASRHLDRNGGKGEAVRLGMRAAIEGGAALVGYYDADLATPPSEMARLVEVLRADRSLAGVLGSRVALLGHRIDRSGTRHYLGRVFATAGSRVLGLAVYDTQCGAKVFRRGPALHTALAAPFVSRWAFDVELIGRLVDADACELQEVPLKEWCDVSGSKLTARAAATAAVDLLRLRQRLKSQLSASRRAPDRSS